jgi:hypothetical protein
MKYLKTEQFLDLFQKHIKNVKKSENDEKWSNNEKRPKWIKNQEIHWILCQNDIVTKMVENYEKVK